MLVQLRFATALSMSAAIALLLAPSGALANQFVAAYAAHLDYHDATADSKEDFHRVDRPLSGPATASVNGGAWDVRASTSFGSLHALASGNFSASGGGTHSIGNHATSSFEDELYFDTGTPGETGIATFTIILDGTLVATGGAGAFVDLLTNGTSPFHMDVSAADGALGLPVYQTLIFTTSFTSGQRVDVHGSLYVGADIFFNGAGAGYARADFSNTAKWGGLQSVVAASGRDITGVTKLTSASGFDYATAPTGVPEPTTWALMLVGFGGLGTIMRQRRSAGTRVTA